MTLQLWTILLLPLASFGIISLFLLKRPGIASLLSTGAAFAGAALALRSVMMRGSLPSSYTWLHVGSLQVNIEFIWDPLAQIMILVVTGIGALIHLYSMEYMKHDPSKARFFANLSLFMFSMLGIVLAKNFIMMFIFWELVGLSSYLLIGFWFEKSSAADAGKKAFLVNKIGDFGMITGIILVWTVWHTVDFKELRAADPSLAGNLLPLIALLLFCGTVGKSAQFPLHVWLPDAMEGPTPVSALIHAATMVAAGVYLLCRIFFILAIAPQALEVIAWVGGITACLAALWAIGQDDIKRILAYSTLSQLGYMVMAVGTGGPDASMFHLTTHACFKALLFLGAGSVIHALHHEQNIWNMGGLVRRMPVTSITFAVGLLALCGVPFFSGSLSKDAILEAVWNSGHPRLFGLGVFTAFLTSFYMARLYVVAFLKPPSHSHSNQSHENGLCMLLPLVILAVFSFSPIWKHTIIYHAVETVSHNESFHFPAAFHTLLLVIPFLGLGAGWWMYASSTNQDPLTIRFPSLRNALASKFYFDEIYLFLVRKIQGGFATLLQWIETLFIDGLGVKGASLTPLGFGHFIQFFQSGNLQSYAIYLGLAVVYLIYHFLIH